MYYPTSTDLRHAYEQGLLELPTRNNAANGTWTGTDRDGPELPYDDRPPPQSIAPGGQRFAVDEDSQFVEWMDYSFYYSFSRDTGMRIWDVKYKGERILYELGLTEALAHYAGNDPVQSGTSYLGESYPFPVQLLSYLQRQLRIAKSLGEQQNLVSSPLMITY